MPNTLILIRHSHSQVDPARPASKWRLSETGRLRCTSLADRLVTYRPDLIVSSVEPKAIETGALVAARLGVPYESAGGLHEHEREHVGWLPEPAFADVMAAFFARPDELTLGEETAAQARDRFERTLGSVLDMHAGKTIAVVTHGTVLTLFIVGRMGVAPMPFWRRLGLPAIVVLSLPDLELLEVVERFEISG